MQKDEFARNDHLFPRASDSLVLSDGCTLCQEAGLAFVGRDIIWGNGARNAKVMVVGKDSAGAEPDQPLWRGSRCTGMPLTNKKSGAKLRIMLDKACLPPSSVFITNTVKCNEGHDERGVSYEDLATVCLKYLRQELAIIRPKALIALGVPAAERVWGLWTNRKLLAPMGLHPAVTLDGFPPFTGTLNEGTREEEGHSAIEVFALMHPSIVEGSREVPYVANLRAIAARLG
jgi:uracil-DNA glycosylase family 4